MTSETKNIESIHGHEVLEMISESETLESRAQLLQKIDHNFGADAVFHTCGGENMNAQGLVDFLERRGKVAYGAKPLNQNCNTDCD